VTTSTKVTTLYVFDNGDEQLQRGYRRARRSERNRLKRIIARVDKVGKAKKQEILTL
jgi:hypothetical protein